MKHWLLILLVSLMSNFLSISLSAGSCYLGVKTSGDFNPALVSQYIREINPKPYSGISGDTECVNDVSSVTSDSGKILLFKNTNLLINYNIGE